MFRCEFKKDPETGKSFKSLVPVTSEAEYRNDRNSAYNLDTLNKVRTMYDEYYHLVSEGADEQTLKRFKDESINKTKSHLLEYVYSCIPGEDMRLKGCTLCSPWVGMDVDFDPSDPDFELKRKEAPARIISMANELGLGMLENSAGKGNHVVFRRHPEMTQEENLRWASNLIGCKFDENAKDITRVFYTTSASPEDLLYLSPDLFEPEANQPVEAPTSVTATEAPKVESTQTMAVPQEMIETTTGNPSAYSYMDYTFQEIIDKYWELFNDGKTPHDGARNTLTFELAVILRHICDFDVNRMAAIIPCYDGLPNEEKIKTIANANNEPRKGMPYRLRKVFEALKADNKKPSMPLGMSDSIPPLYTGRMPEPLRKITATTPQHLKTTVSEGVFAALATHLHGVTFQLIDGSICEPALMQILIYRQSRGKGSLDKPIECIIEDLQNHDDDARNREQEWKLKNPSGSSKKKQPRPDDLYIQICQSDMTNAAFVQRLIDVNRNEQRVIFTQMQELDEITALSVNGKNDVSRIIRKGFDRKKYGQERVGTDSVTGVAPLRWNFTAATTPNHALQICTPWVSDGTLSRCNLLTIDPQETPGQPKYKPITQQYKDSLAPYIARLNNATGFIRCKKAEQLAQKLTSMLDDEYAETDSESLSTFASRAITIAYFKAMILYIMQGKWNRDIEDYVTFSLRRDLWVKLHFFGKKLEDDIAKEQNMPTFQAKKVLDILPNTFSEEQFIKGREQLGLKGNPKEHLKKLKQRHRIDFDDTIQMYVKIQDNEES